MNTNERHFDDPWPVVAGGVMTSYMSGNTRYRDEIHSMTVGLKNYVHKNWGCGSSQRGTKIITNYLVILE